MTNTSECKDCSGMSSQEEGNDVGWEPDPKEKKQRTLEWQLYLKKKVWFISHYLIIFKNNIIILL